MWRRFLSVPVLILISLVLLLPALALGRLVVEARNAGFDPLLQAEGLFGAVLALLVAIGAIWRLVIVFRRERRAD